MLLNLFIKFAGIVPLSKGLDVLSKNKDKIFTMQEEYDNAEKVIIMWDHNGPKEENRNPVVEALVFNFESNMKTHNLIVGPAYDLTGQEALFVLQATEKLATGLGMPGDLYPHFARPGRGGSVDNGDV